MKKEDIEKAAIKRLPYTDEECADSNYVLGKNVGFKRGFIAGARWRINSLWHKTKDEVPQAIGEEYEDDVYPQIPCLVHGYLSTGYGYGVRYWNVEGQVWDNEECDDYECNRDAIEEWCYLDDLLPERKEG